jgi:hypothetical protein
MKLSRDTLQDPLSDAQIAALIRLDVHLHLTHVTADVYYDDPSYLARWARAIHRAGLHVWFRAHWYAWEDHQGGRARGHMSPSAYLAATQRFLQQHAALFQNGDIFDFCSEPENGAYWRQTYGPGWSWRNQRARQAFNAFIRDGVAMATATLASLGHSAVMVRVVSVNDTVALGLLSAPTVHSLGLITIDLYPELTTRDPVVATQRLVAAIAAVHRRWGVPVLLGEHGYPRDMAVDDTTQARVLATELAVLTRLPYLIGLNYWVDAGGPGYGGYTNLYRRVRATWQPRPAAAVLAQAFGTGGIASLPSGLLSPTLSPATAPLGWRIRAADALALPTAARAIALGDRQLATLVGLAGRLHLTHVAVDGTYDDPSSLARWARAIHRAGLHVWFRTQWYAWAIPHPGGTALSPMAYLAATRRFWESQAGLLENGDIVDFCPEPEQGAYWRQTYGNGWSWRNQAAQAAYNAFIRDGVAMLRTTLARRNLPGVVVNVVAVNIAVALHTLDAATVRQLGQVTLDLYPERQTRDPATAARLLGDEIASVHRRWGVPILIGAHGYARDREVDDGTQARVLSAELNALEGLPYLRGFNYWAIAGAPGSSGHTSLYRAAGAAWQPRPAAAVLARAFAAEAPSPQG